MIYNIAVPATFGIALLANAKDILGFQYADFDSTTVEKAGYREPFENNLRSLLPPCAFPSSARTRLLATAALQQRRDGKIDGIQTAMCGDSVRIHYTIKLANGTVFDTSIGDDPYSFRIGHSWV
eukprot:gnl/MRDRNA2_/MRDRNA2_25063_c0_seq2.p1 gnl/MRDRNA2_/MRDRNA2_25063_c0~~gnl/MRDRNA2_/MRDRNA2_25063_c0_seq2.p1  ORF type:complete len:124 (+),score=15.59 gnl/MRDRNA2_/MRDRNA2_25063_c0_seq2:61-432(+)